MSRIEWEYDLVERPFCQQLQTMGWTWIEGSLDDPQVTERTSFREVILHNRLAAALVRINLRSGKPWLDESRITKAIRDLSPGPGQGLLEINQAVTQFLLKGTVVDGLPDWDQGRPQVVKYIDFDHLENNDFLVVNQFKVELSSGQGHIVPDAVLFVNGLPLVVAEFKSPGIEEPIRQAINQLLRYSNQRRELFPALYTENEGVEELFHTNQLLIASNFFEARAATLGAPPEAYREWTDTSPVPLSRVAEELGVVSTSQEVEAAKGELMTVGPAQAEGVGTPLVFRKQDQRPEALRTKEGASLQSQQLLTVRTRISLLPHFRISFGSTLRHGWSSSPTKRQDRSF